MKVESTRTGAPASFRHAAGFYRNHADLVAQAVPIVRSALARGEPVGVALRPAAERALRAAVGSPAGVISLADPAGVHPGSSQTTASRCARELRAFAGDVGAATMLSQHTARLDGPDGSFWTELDAALNIACADVAASLTCFFPKVPRHPGILVGARRNHPLLLVGSVLRANPEHRTPLEVLAELPPATPPLLGPPHLRLAFRAWQLHDIRRTLEELLRDAGFARSRAEDIVLAVNEVATNAVQHGTLQAELLAWMDGAGLVCEVHDGGTLQDPLPGLRSPQPGERRGRGLWIARQLCDLLHVWSDWSGTRVRLGVAR